MGNEKVLRLDNINPSVLEAQYAVRGAISLRATEMIKLIKDNPETHGLPFDEVVPCNIGNPQALKQKPISFFRRVLSCTINPELLEHKDLFPADVIERASGYYENLVSTGAYSHSQGLLSIRENVAKFIEERDGYPANPDHIFLSNGASTSISNVMLTLIKNKNSGILIPIPQYPLYTATLSLLGGTCVPYYLTEENQWSLDIPELDKALKKARNEGIDVHSLVVISPGNPTGSYLDVENMKEIVNFCVENKLVLLADEVYQENIYEEGLEFQSFKKTVCDMKADIEMFSFHSTSKGFIGECGVRGGYMEIYGISPEVKAELYKVASISLCPNLTGQIMTDLMVCPPKPGQPSYDEYNKEKHAILDSLKRRKDILVKAFNQMEGVVCQDANSSMYIFPTIKLPEKAIAKAESEGMSPDTFYCHEMIEATGVSTVPGSGFKQKEGTWHFRCTFLPQESKFDNFIKLILDFHKKFMDTYR